MKIIVAGVYVPSRYCTVSLVCSVPESVGEGEKAKMLTRRGGEIPVSDEDGALDGEGEDKGTSEGDDGCVKKRGRLRSPASSKRGVEDELVERGGGLVDTASK